MKALGGKRSKRRISSNAALQSQYSPIAPPGTSTSNQNTNSIVQNLSTQFEMARQQQPMSFSSGTSLSKQPQCISADKENFQDMISCNHKKRKDATNKVRNVIENR